MKIDMKRLESVRGLYRTLMMVFLAIEIVAVVLIAASLGLAGVMVGVAAMVCYFVVKHAGKTKFGDACAHVQAEASLGLEDFVWQGRVPFDGRELHESGLVSSVLKIDSTLRQHALQGTAEGVRLSMSEVSFGVVYPGQNRHEFNAGAMLTAPMAQPVETPVLLLGHNSFRHKLIRKEYEDDGWKLCPVGGKAKGWFVFTPDGSIPEQGLLDRLDALNRAAGNQVAVSLKGGEATAFFLGGFYTDRYPLGDAPDEKALRKRLFDHVAGFAALVK